MRISEMRPSEMIALLIFALIICLLILIGSIHTLFDSTEELNNHLKADGLEIELYLTHFKEYSPNEQGVLDEKESAERVDLKKDSSPLFDITNAVPHSKYEATIEIQNPGTLAFNYGVRIIWQANDDDDDNDVDFAKQIKITISGENIDNEAKSVSFMLSDAAKQENSVHLGYLLAGSEAQSFKVQAEFVNADNNNSAQGASLDFDIQVYATQKTKAN